jgi:hypothetical protein
MTFLNSKYNTAFKIVFFAIFILLAILQIRKLVTFDTISLAFLVIGTIPILLPYLTKNFRSIEVFGVKAELLEKIEVQKDKLAVQEVKLQEQQDFINELVKYSMSASIFDHLCGISLLNVYLYNDNEYFRREMYFLRDNGFIRPKGSGFLDFNEKYNHSNLVDIAEPTPIGMTFVRLRKDQIPSQMLKDLENLRISPENI